MYELAKHEQEKIKLTHYKTRSKLLNKGPIG
jgi:hypothetical protein